MTNPTMNQSSFCSCRIHDNAIHVDGGGFLWMFPTKLVVTTIGTLMLPTFYDNNRMNSKSNRGGESINVWFTDRSYGV